MNSPAAVVSLRPNCRLCGSRDLVDVWSFGETPLANSYLRAEEIGKPELFAPLTVGVCQSCHLAQLRHTVDPTILFSRYLYVSSTSPTFVRHFGDYADTLSKRFTRSQDRVIDVGSNDGILLKSLKAKGIRVLGIEPARNIAALARADGIDTVAEFLTPALAKQLVASYGSATVITANNVFAHTDNIVSFVEAIKILLAPKGVYIFEVQYLGDLLEKNLFDIVYHEHLCYYHLRPLVTFFSRQGMKVFDVERQVVHGGSIRVYVEHEQGPYAVHERVGQLLAEEETRGLNTTAPYQAFALRIQKNKEKLSALLQPLKGAGKRIVGYGAPAKATTFMYVFGLDKSMIEYIVDDDKKFKQGLYMPGTHIPIVAPDRLSLDHPDYCLVLAWNFAESIIGSHRSYLKQGGRFILPVPEPVIIES